MADQNMRKQIPHTVHVVLLYFHTYIYTLVVFIHVLYIVQALKKILGYFLVAVAFLVPLKVCCCTHQKMHTCLHDVHWQHAFV